MSRRLVVTHEAHPDPVGSAASLADSLKALISGRSAKAPVDLALQVQLPDKLVIPRTLEAAGYCICEAALDNALRHSGAGRVTVEIAFRHDRLIVRIADDGMGFEPAVAPPKGGLHRMGEYARRGSGRLDLRSAPGAGTCVSAVFPVSRAPRD